MKLDRKDLIPAGVLILLLVSFVIAMIGEPRPPPPLPKFKVTFKQGQQFTVCGRGRVHGDCIRFENGSGGCGEFIVERIGMCE